MICRSQVPRLCYKDGISYAHLFSHSVFTPTSPTLSFRTLHLYPNFCALEFRCLLKAFGGRLGTKVVEMKDAEKRGIVWRS